MRPSASWNGCWASRLVNMAGNAARLVLDRGRTAWETRAALKAWEQVAPEVQGHVPVIAYYGSGAQYLYQIRDWLQPLERVAEQVPVAIMVRDPRVALELQDMTSVPVVLARWLADIDRVMTDHSPDVLLYVNQNVSNFDVLAYARPHHVFLSHGESDKVYMVSNQAKAYDRTFVAGQAAVDRYASALHDFDVQEKLTVVGRPQASIHEEPPSDLPDTPLPQTVVYAPTTEGSSVVMEYGSLASHGVQLVSALLASGKYRVIFRPHPQAGRRLRSHAQAVDEITALIDSTPGGHYVDHTAHFGWHRDVADALVCDISAVAVDWLPTGKPLVITEPVQQAAPILDGGMLAQTSLLPAGRAGNIVQALDEAGEPEALVRQEAWTDYYFAPGDVGTFVSAVLELVAAGSAGPE